MAMDYMISRFANEPSSPLFEQRKISVKQKLRGKSEEGEKSSVSMVMETDVAEDNCLPPEIEEGNVEYKVKLVNPSTSRMQHLITQMKWRLREGQGEAIYELGVEDGGNMAGLTDRELEASMRTIKKMATALNASLVTLSERDVSSKTENAVRRRVVEVLVRKVPDNQQFIELRLAFLGGVDAGKSTLCGVLTQGVLDNGHGKARLNIFRYLHEFQTGRTSSICLDVIGFDSQGKLINYAEHSMEEMVEQSTKLITLIDLAGDRRYLKTTIYGLTGYHPHFAALVISAVTGPTSVTREHLGVAVALNIAVFVIITKVDAVSSSALEKVLKSVEKLLKRPGRIPKRVNTVEDAVSCASAMVNQDVVPIMTLSSVTATNLNLLEHFLNVLPPSGLSKAKQEELSLAAPLFSIDEVFKVPHVGVVVCGLLTDGILNEGELMKVGPDVNGGYHSVKIESIHRNKQPVRCVKPGEAASVAISLKNLEDVVPVEVRRGMVMINEKDDGIACRRFTARFYLLYHHAPEICVGFQATVYIGSVCQTVTVIGMDAPSALPLVWITARFEFYRNPEFVRVGTPLIFREGRTKGMGEVIDVELLEDKELAARANDLF